VNQAKFEIHLTSLLQSCSSLPPYCLFGVKRIRGLTCRPCATPRDKRARAWPLNSVRREGFHRAVPSLATSLELAKQTYHCSAAGMGGCLSFFLLESFIIKSELIRRVSVECPVKDAAPEVPAVSSSVPANI
jgi:hypothetical protein